MAKPKRIPYAANGLLDETKMRITDAIHDLMPLIKCASLTPEERIALPAQAILHLRDGLETIDRLKQLVSDELNILAP